ncbi:MAG TPA: aspartate kinase [Alphaproteobacteria bacterium]|nr:aspartate kinase [Alphaproteobacteria bacterium]
MALIVQKFGGTSVGSTERIKNVVTKVKKELDLGNQVVVVVSAMSGETNRLVGFCEELNQLTTTESLQEYDSIVASGENVTSGLLALALQTSGIKARSMLSWQVPILTDAEHSKARIEEIEGERIKHWLDKGNVVVIPGFQGVTMEQNLSDRRITTLGRGGSDTSAVAVAAALKADRCDIYTDVDGVYTSDPRLVPKARKLNKIAYEEVLELASLGAKVLHSRCVELAMKFKVRTQVLTSFEDKPGTELVEEDEVLERRLITGVTYSKNDAQITLKGVHNTPGIAAKVFGPLSEAAINVDMIVQNVSKDAKKADITFTIPKTDVAKAEEVLNSSGLKFESIYKNLDVAKVSVVGVGMRSHVGIAQKMFETLANKGINIHVISTSEIKISVIIDDEFLELAMRSLHTAYGLDKKD